MSFDKLVKYAQYMDSTGYPIVANAFDMACASSGGNYSVALRNLTAYSTLLDNDGFTVQSDFIDTFVNLSAMRKNAELPSAAEKYDAKGNNASGFFTALVEEDKGDPAHNIETWEGGKHSLLTRYSPDYPGVMMLRISDGIYQDMLSRKIYDFQKGFISDTGERHYGGSVSSQTPNSQNYLNSPQIMDSQHLKVRRQ